MQDQLAATAAAHEQAVVEAALLREGADQQQVTVARVLLWCNAVCCGFDGKVAKLTASKRAPGVECSGTLSAM